MPLSFVIVCVACFIWFLVSLLVLNILLFVLRYIQAAHAKYVDYFSNYIWVIAWFCVFTFAYTILFVGALLPAILNETAVLDGIRLVDAQMYAALVAQNQWIVGLNVRRNKIFDLP